MDEPQLPLLQLAKLRMKLDETAARHAGEIGALREEIRRLERAVGAAVPPPLPEPAPVPVVLPVEPAVEFKEAPPPPDRYPKPERTRELPPPDLPPPMAAPAVDRGELELNLGRVWLVRIGIVLLVTGLVLLGNYAYRNWIRDLPAAVRLGFLVLSSLAMAGAGWWCTRREKLRAFGEVVLAGGMAFFYWCAYAGHHVPRLRVFDSVVAGTLAMLAAAAAIVAVSVARNARTTAVMGLLLASYSTVLQPMTTLTAVSNVLLAATGVALVAMKRWRAPGFASMAGTYGAFLYWQLSGAAGAGGVTPALVFVAVLWAVFAVPAVGRMEGIDDRARAWWSGLNNAAGFGLFSLVWLLAGWDGYWRVPASAGLLWLGLGAAGRRRSVSAETTLVQGLAALTLALVLKLEGYHLGVGLAIEALLMAGAFRRFRKWPELSFAVLTMLAATAWVFVRPGLPVWSIAVVSALLAGASIVLRRSGVQGWLETPGRLAAGAGVICAAAAGLLWCGKLPTDWRPVTATVAAGLLGWRVIRGETRARMPEVFGTALVVALAGGLMMLGANPADWSLWAVAAVSCAAAWLWERHGRPATPEHRGGRAVGASVAAWLHAIGVVAALGIWLLDLDGFSTRFWIRVAVAVAVPLIAWRFLKCPRLRSAATLLLVLPLIDVLDGRFEAWWIDFAPVLAAWLVWRLGGIDESFERPGAGVHAVLSRGVGGLGWMVAWYLATPEVWGDLLGLSVLGGWWVWRRFLRELHPIELLVWSLAALVAFVAELTFAKGGGVPSGWGVSAALVAAVFLRTRRNRPEVDFGIGWGAVILTTLWASNWLLRRFDFEALTILWTVLGFAWVSIGLWRRFATLRLGGFALLLLSIGKLFVHDVWRFDTFTRVAAFLALGVAMVLLGFFYNRFAELLKRWVVEEEREEPSAE